jgi:hypothetical protein
MPKSYAQLQQSLTFDELMKTLDEQFRTIPDNRTGNAVQYQLPDVLKAAFAMFPLKHPSLLDFKTQSTAEENNLRNIYRIEGNIPSEFSTSSRIRTRAWKGNLPGDGPVGKSKSYE